MRNILKALGIAAIALTLTTGTVHAVTILFPSGGGTGWGSPGGLKGGFVLIGNDLNPVSTSTSLYVDTGNSRVGIGTIVPQSKLDVSGGVSVGSYAGSIAAPSNGMIVSGNVGIGTSSPSATMSIKAPGTSFERAFALSDSDDFERFTVLSNGYMGINTTPAKALTIGQGDIQLDADHTIYFKTSVGDEKSVLGYYGDTTYLDTDTSIILRGLGNTQFADLNSATSSFSGSGGIDIAHGCFAINGVCVINSNFPTSTKPLIATYFVATSSTATSSFPLASTTALQVGNSYVTQLTGTGLTITGGSLTNSGVISVSCTTITCSGTNPASFSIGSNAIANSQLANSSISLSNGGGLIISGSPISLGGTGTLTAQVSTSSVPTVGRVAYWTGNGTPSSLGSVATSSETCTSPISCAAHDVLTGGGAITISQSNSSTNGYLSSTDWNTFNGKPGYPFALANNATSTLTRFSGGLESYASSTISSLTITNGTTTNATSTNLVVSNYLNVTGSATTTLSGALTVGAGQGTSTFANGISAVNISLTGNAATNTAAQGFNLTKGCFSINNVCISGAGSGNVNSGTVNQMAYYTGSTAVNSSGFVTNDNSNSRLGIGTTTPNWQLQQATTRPFHVLSDTSAALNAKHWFITSQGGNFYVGTSSDALSATSTYMTIGNGGNVGIGTSSPYATLSVVGASGVVADKYTATNTAATSTFPGVSVSSGRFASGAFGVKGYVYHDYTNDVPFLGIYDTGNSLYYGIATGLPAPAGTSVLGGYFKGLGVGCSQTNVHSACFGVLQSTQTSAGIGNTDLTVYGDHAISDFYNTLNNGSGRMGIGTTTPFAALSISTSTQSSGSTPLFAVASTTNTTIFNVLGNGNVGIGSTTPNTALSVGNGTASSTIVVAEYDYGKSGNEATSTTKIIDGRTANQILWPMGTSATTLTLCNLLPGQHLMIKVQNPNAVAGALTWAACSGYTLQWAGGSVPSQTTAANKADIWSFSVFFAGGSTATSTKNLIINGAQTANLF